MKNESKSTLRKQIKKELLKQQHLFPEFSKQILNHLLQDPKIERAKKIGIYHPWPFEPDLLELWKGNPEKFLFPKVEGQSMSYYQADLDLVVDPLEIDLLIVPGLAFDSKGFRLGSGKGFFDRFLAENQIATVGVCFSFQILPHLLPRESHDIPMERLLTENGYYLASS